MSQTIESTNEAVKKLGEAPDAEIQVESTESVIVGPAIPSAVFISRSTVAFRTSNILNAIQALSQLSYTPTYELSNFHDIRFGRFAGDITFINVKRPLEYPLRALPNYWNA